MNEVTLFEIPIYSMEEKEFNKRWNKEIKNIYILTNNINKYGIIFYQKICGNIIRSLGTL